MSRDTAQDRAHHEDPVIRVLAAALDEGESARGPGRRRWVWTTERRGPAWWRRSLRWTAAVTLVASAAAPPRRP
ncbi:hypothetical protein F9L07_06550 [Pimelobacter simplex]|uniref:Uncharacterized protein n=1 Tax=Nocardioides simplex TaxID=2045 RepID=A0A7J5E062_NOCSI|nr:hypothetical protein [Pimelobacter simplex]KAB2811533.1 hypothetical protein F9L07_06550 [Pimelobacter simplex]